MIVLNEELININPTSTSGKVAKIGLGLGTIGALSVGTKNAVNSLENPEIPPHPSFDSQENQD